MHMRKILFLILFVAQCNIVYAIPFTGATLNEAEIQSLYKYQCKEVMVDSSSAKNAMPPKLTEILSQGEKLVKVKILTCPLNNVSFQYFLVERDRVWVMYDAESLVIYSK